MWQHEYMFACWVYLSCRQWPTKQHGSFATLNKAPFADIIKIMTFIHLWEVCMVTAVPHESAAACAGLVQ